MSLLKKENWLVCLLLTILSEGVFNLVLAYFLKLYDKDAWYAKWYYWVLACIPCFVPASIMLIILTIQMGVKVAGRLNVPGYQIYGLPYPWILCIIVPVIGWVIFAVMFIYVMIWPSIMIKQGYGEA